MQRVLETYQSPAHAAAAAYALAAGNERQGHVPAEECLQLCCMLADPLPEELQQYMVGLLTQLTQLPPDYATFRAAVKACMLLHQLSSSDMQRVRVRVQACQHVE